MSRERFPAHLIPASPPSLAPCHSFPAAHVLLRLEQAAAGTWPHRTGLALTTDRVVRAMVGGRAGRLCRSGFCPPCSILSTAPRQRRPAAGPSCIADSFPQRSQRGRRTTAQRSAAVLRHPACRLCSARLKGSSLMDLPSGATQVHICQGSFEAAVRVYELLLRWVQVKVQLQPRRVRSCASTVPLSIHAVLYCTQLRCDCWAAAGHRACPATAFWLGQRARAARAAPRPPARRSVRGGDPHGEELHAPFLRLRLLRSLFLAVQAAAVSEQPPFPPFPGRQLGLCAHIGSCC